MTWFDFTEFVGHTVNRRYNRGERNDDGQSCLGMCLFIRRVDGGVGRVYEEPLTNKEKQIRYVMSFWRGERDFPHGKAWCYNKIGCRQDQCRRAEMERQRKYLRVTT